MIHLKWTHSKPKGTILIDDNFERQTVQCCHCGIHWVFEPGSGRKRGWCFKCNSITCGSSECNICTPYEKALGW